MLGKIDVVAFLLSKHADVDAQDGAGLTAFIRACYSGNYDIGELLVRAGARTDISSRVNTDPDCSECCSRLNHFSFL